MESLNVSDDVRAYVYDLVWLSHYQRVMRDLRAHTNVPYLITMQCTSEYPTVTVPSKCGTITFGKENRSVRSARHKGNYWSPKPLLWSFERRLQNGNFRIFWTYIRIRLFPYVHECGWVLDHLNETDREALQARAQRQASSYSSKIQS